MEATLKASKNQMYCLKQVSKGPYTHGKLYLGQYRTFHKKVQNIMQNAVTSQAQEPLPGAGCAEIRGDEVIE